MDPNAILVGSLAAGVNRLVEGFKLSVLIRYPNLTADQRKAIIVSVSIFVGLVTAFVTPGAGDLFNRSFLGDYEFASRFVLGLGLAFGGEVTMWLLKLMEATYIFVKPTSTTTSEKTLTITETQATPGPTMAQVAEAVYG